jgi:hypothetical protein
MAETEIVLKWGRVEGQGRVFDDRRSSVVYTWGMN